VCGRSRTGSLPAAPPSDSPTRRHGGDGTNADIAGVNDLLSGATVITGDVLYRMLFLHSSRSSPTSPSIRRPPPGRVLRVVARPPDATVRLRSDVAWSDGVAVTAEDVRWTWQAQINPAVAWDYAFAKEGIRDVEAVDPHTVRFHFANAYFSQLADLNEGVILPKHAWEKLPFGGVARHPEWFQEHLVTDGPSTVDSWSPQQELVLVAQPRYFEPDLPRLESVVFGSFGPGQSSSPSSPPARSTTSSRCRRPKRRDCARRPTPSCSPTGRASTAAGLEPVARPQFADAEVRGALTLAIDRQAIVDTLWFGYGKVADSPILSTLWAHASASSPGSCACRGGAHPRRQRPAGQRRRRYPREDGRRFSFEL
jgi:hypothetical protein